MTVFAQLPLLLAALVLAFSAWFGPKAPAAASASPNRRRPRGMAGQTGPRVISRRSGLRWSGSKVLKGWGSQAWRPSWAPLAVSAATVTVGAFQAPSVASAVAERALADSSVLALVLADTYVFPAVYDDEKSRIHWEAETSPAIGALDDLFLADAALDFGGDLPPLPPAHLCDLFASDHGSQHGDLLWT